MRSGALVIVLVMLFSAFTSVAQNANDREPNILESPDSSNVYYLYGSDGWGGVPKGWKIQDRYLKNAKESDLEQTALHSRTPAYRAMAYHALVSKRSKRCYDLLLDRLRDTSTFTIAAFDCYYEHNVASFMLDVTSDAKRPLFTEAQQRHIDSVIVFSEGLDHLNKYAPVSRLNDMDGLYERVKELHLAGTPYLLTIIAEYRNEDDIPLLIAALREYEKGLDHKGANSAGPKGRTNDALNALMIWQHDAFMPVLEELRDFELSRRYIDYYRVKMLFKVVMSYDNEWAYNFIEETFGKMNGKNKFSYPENLFKAYYEEEELPRFRPLVDKYGEEPFDWRAY